MKISLFFIDIEITYHPRSRKEWMYFAGTLVSLVLCCFFACYTIIYVKGEIKKEKDEGKKVEIQLGEQEKKAYTLDEALDIIREHFNK
ncbi:MAG: hypothetical protein HYV59_03575 [Planctomycetes bacterium]|nr:hypothetical protein [Planctomycetota bacterium]